MNESQSEKLQDYLTLSKMSYDNAIKYLIKKYGSAKDDYFRETSYQHFMNGEIKRPTRGKYSRGIEGLYAHHIAEIKYPDLANVETIKYLKYPFELQKKDGLVYCDVFEHLILHAIIVHETAGELGIGGYGLFILPMVQDWYIQGILPKPAWMQVAYHRAFMDPDETQKLVDYLNKQLIGEAIEILDFLKEPPAKTNTYEEWYDRVKEHIATVPGEYFKAGIIIDGNRSTPKIIKAVEEMAHYCNNSSMEITDEKFEAIFQKRFSKFFKPSGRLGLIKQIETAKNRRIENKIQADCQAASEAVSHQVKLIDAETILNNNGIQSSDSRENILFKIFQHKSSEIYPTFQDIKSARINSTKDRLLDELAVLLSEESTNSTQQ